VVLLLEAVEAKIKKDNFNFNFNVASKKLDEGIIKVRCQDEWLAP